MAHFWCRRPSERTLDVPMVHCIWHVFSRDPGHPDQFSYIDSWLEIARNPPTWVQFIHSKQSQAKVLATLSRDSPREPKKQPTAPLVFAADPEEDPFFLPLYDSRSSLTPAPELETPPPSVSPPPLLPPPPPSLLPSWTRRTLPHKNQQPDCTLGQAQVLSRCQSTSARAKRLSSRGSEQGLRSP